MFCRFAYRLAGFGNDFRCEGNVHEPVREGTSALATAMEKFPSPSQQIHAAADDEGSGTRSSTLAARRSCGISRTAILQ
jgi:hypothetical protein